MTQDIKTDMPGIYRSPQGFLINKDNNSLAAYKAKKQRDKELDKMKEEMTSLKDDILEIKEMLKKVLK